MSRRFDAGYYISEGVHSIFTHGFMSFAAVCMIVACLIIMGSFSLLAVNLDNTLGDLENENEMIVYIDETLNLGQAQAMKSTLAQVDNVSQLTFVSRQQALADFKAKHGGENSVMADLPADALRDRYRVHVVDIEKMAETKAALEQVEGVGDVNAATEIADGFVMVRNIATGVIEWPFVVEGILLGLSGALIAFFAQWGLYQLVAKLAIQGNGLSLVSIVSYSSMAPTILMVFCAVGAVIGVGGSLVAIRKFLQV